MVEPFPNHPNYVGYDAVAGKPGKYVRDKPQLVGLTALPKRADFKVKLEPAWLAQLQAVWQWAFERGYTFTIPPFDYQIAKVITADATFVLYASRRGKARYRFIKPVMEGALKGEDLRATADFDALEAMVK